MKLQFSFLPIPEELMKSKAISWGAKHLFGIIAKVNQEKVRRSVRHFSQRMNCSSRETTRRIAELRKNNLIRVIEHKGGLNEYVINLELIQIIQTPDQTDGGKTQANSGRGGQANSGRGASHKEPINKKENVASEVATVYPSFLDKLLESNQRHIHIIGIWVREVGIELPNEAIYKSVIKRNLRPAKLLEGYKDEQIIQTIKVVKATDYIKKFTLETVGKFIDSVVAESKKQGRKIIRWEEIKTPDGIKMKPIYEISN